MTHAMMQFNGHFVPRRPGLCELKCINGCGKVV